MASPINTNLPVGNDREAIETRQNFQAAQDQIDALGGGTEIADLQAAVADLQTRVTALENAASAPVDPARR